MSINNQSFIFLLAFTILFNSCQDVTREDESSLPKKDTISHKTINVNGPEQVKQWLSETIIEYFNNGNLTMEDITTTHYAQYKNDAISVIYPNDKPLSEKEFHAKWKNQFNTAKAGIGNGFLIDGQDWGAIEVKKCDVIQDNNDTFTCDVVIIDKDYKAEYKRIIKVITDTQKGFLIADVLEEN